MTTMDSRRTGSNLDRASDDTQDTFLSFCLGSDEFGVETLRVREIISALDITPLPQAKSFVKGLINLRGKIIPVIELRNTFDMPAVEPTEQTRIIVVEVIERGSHEQFEMGMIVDSVREIRSIARSQIKPATHFGDSFLADFILGAGAIGEGKTQRSLILLNIDKVLTTRTKTKLAQVVPDTSKDSEDRSAA